MAEVFNFDFEAGNLTEFDTTSDSFITFDAHGDAAATGSYGMRMIAGTGYGQYAISPTETELYLGFHYNIDANISIDQYGYVELFQVRDAGGIDAPKLWLYRPDSGTGAPTQWRVNLGNTEIFSGTTNVTLGSQIWVEMHMVTGSASGGAQLWVDGTSVGSDFTTDMSLGTGLDRIRIGTVVGPLAAGQYAYMDNIIADDAARVTEPTEGGGSSAVAIMVQMN